MSNKELKAVVQEAIEADLFDTSVCSSCDFFDETLECCMDPIPALTPVGCPLELDGQLTIDDI